MANFGLPGVNSVDDLLKYRRAELAEAQMLNVQQSDLKALTTLVPSEYQSQRRQQIAEDRRLTLRERQVALAKPEQDRRLRRLQIDNAQTNARLDRDLNRLRHQEQNQATRDQIRDRRAEAERRYDLDLQRTHNQAAQSARDFNNSRGTQVQEYLSQIAPGTTGKALSAGVGQLLSSGHPYLAAAAALGTVLTSVTGDPIDNYTKWRDTQQKRGLVSTYLGDTQQWKDYVDIFPKVQLPDIDEADPDAIFSSRHQRLDNMVSFAEGCVREAKIRWLSNSAVTDMRG